MAQTHLVVIPLPVTGHLYPALDLAHLLVSLDHRLSISVFIISIPSSNGEVLPPALLANYHHPRIHFKILPDLGVRVNVSSENYFTRLVDSYRFQVQLNVIDLSFSISSGSSQPQKLGGFVLDMFCTSLIDVAEFFNLPSYIFYTSSSAMLGVMLHLQKLRDDDAKDMTEYLHSVEKLAFPGFTSPLPTNLLPSIVQHPHTVELFLDTYRKIRKAKGIIVNTFYDLEPRPLMHLLNEPHLPMVYQVGPILRMRGSMGREDRHEALKWLDRHPEATVVFLCFGLTGRFDEAQVREIAKALVMCRYPFLWSLQPLDQVGQSSDDGEDLRQLLPSGFLELVSGIGKVMGWVPQAEILAHPSTGGFVTHCGWNSILEAIWFGVPMATWPIYSDQHLNAYYLGEMKLATNITMNFRRDYAMVNGATVYAEEIAAGIQALMQSDEKRRKMKDMKERSRMAHMEGNYSHIALHELVEHVLER